jgi:hypothetical protein
MRATKQGHRAAYHSHAAASCSQLSKFLAYGEPAPCSAQRLARFTQQHTLEGLAWTEAETGLASAI